MIMWTAEEFGLLGAEQYIRNHAAENGNLQFVMESDFGTFTPTGLEISGNKMTQCILQRIMRLVPLIFCFRLIYIYYCDYKILIFLFVIFKKFLSLKNVYCFYNNFYF